MKQMYSEAIRCEGLRADVFAGKRTPMRGQARTTDAGCVARDEKTAL